MIPCLRKIISEWRRVVHIWILRHLVLAFQFLAMAREVFLLSIKIENVDGLIAINCLDSVVVALD